MDQGDNTWWNKDTRKMVGRKLGKINRVREKEDNAVPNPRVESKLWHIWEGGARLSGRRMAAGQAPVQSWGEI